MHLNIWNELSFVTADYSYSNLIYNMLVKYKDPNAKVQIEGSKNEVDSRPLEPKG